MPDQPEAVPMRGNFVLTADRYPPLCCGKRELLPFERRLEHRSSGVINGACPLHRPRDRLPAGIGPFRLKAFYDLGVTRRNAVCS